MRNKKDGVNLTAMEASRTSGSGSDSLTVETSGADGGRNDKDGMEKIWGWMDEK